MDATSSWDGFGAFVTDVTLEAVIHWEGRMIVTWLPALVREGDMKNQTNEANSTVSLIDTETEKTGIADSYNITCMEAKDCEYI